MKSRTLKAAAGRRIVFEARTDYVSSDSTTQINVAPVDPYASGVVSCTRTVSFVTEPGHAYEVIQKASFGSGCPVAVKDKATGEQPSTLKLSDSPVCGAHHKD